MRFLRVYYSILVSPHFLVAWALLVLTSLGFLRMVTTSNVIVTLFNTSTYILFSSVLCLLLLMHHASLSPTEG